MSYNPQKSSELNLSLQQKLERDIGVCRKMVDTLNSKGWIDIVAPLIDKMIIDVVGGKVGERWVSGSLSKAKSDEKREFYIGYKQALIDLHNRCQSYAIQLKLKSDELKYLREEEKNPTDSIKHSRYNPEGGLGAI